MAAIGGASPQSKSTEKPPNPSFFEGLVTKERIAKVAAYAFSITAAALLITALITLPPVGLIAGGTIIGLSTEVLLVSSGVASILSLIPTLVRQDQQAPQAQEGIGAPQAPQAQEPGPSLIYQTRATDEEWAALSEEEQDRKFEEMWISFQDEVMGQPEQQIPPFQDEVMGQPEQQIPPFQDEVMGQLEQQIPMPKAVPIEQETSKDAKTMLIELLESLEKKKLVLIDREQEVNAQIKNLDLGKTPKKIIQNLVDKSIQINEERLELEREKATYLNALKDLENSFFKKRELESYIYEAYQTEQINHLI